MSTPPLPRGDEEDLEVDSDELAWNDKNDSRDFPATHARSQPLALSSGCRGELLIPRQRIFALMAIGSPHR